MEKLAILLDGRKCGEVSVQEQGLYRDYRAECELKMGSEPVRLFLVGEQGELRLGVPQPEGGRFVLRRQLSAKEAGGAGRLLRGELRPFVSREGSWQSVPEPWELFRENQLRRQLQGIQGALVYHGGNRRFVALPFDTGKPFPLTDMFCLARVRRIGQREYAVFCFDREERPVLP